MRHVLTVSVALDIPERGQTLAPALRAQVANRIAAHGMPRPRVYAMEWLDPPFAAGHWVPEMIAVAGGEEVLGRAGQPSFRVTWETVIAARPEVVLLIPCGYDAEAVQREWDVLPKPPGWHTIPAARNGRVHALDANSYCSRPSPRVVDGIEHLAVLFHPDLSL
jgi:iron complex transport system substrate-binding protein